jgi:hypothetical protein
MVPWMRLVSRPRPEERQLAVVVRGRPPVRTLAGATPSTRRAERL